jgi:uncharacterized protein YndB with AHSA1/START domain
MKLDLELEQIYPHPVMHVWSALTDRAALAAWLMPSDFEARLGHRFTFRAEPPPGSNWRGWTECEIVELTPPSRMVWSWKSAEPDCVTSVVFELEEVPGGTRLRLSHAGDTTGPDIGDLNQGWPAKLEQLRDCLGTAERMMSNE